LRIVPHGTEAGDGGAALPAGGSSTKTKRRLEEGKGMPESAIEPWDKKSRLISWRFQQMFGWDLVKVEPLEVDPVTNKTRILAFCPSENFKALIKIDDHVDMDKLEVVQRRDYEDFMEHIKSFKPHVITMDYDDAFSGEPGSPSFKITPSPPIVNAIQTAIDEDEISPQYFLIVGNTLQFCRNLALSEQTDGWFIKSDLHTWPALPHKPDYWYDYDDVDKYFEDSIKNANMEVPEVLWPHIPPRHFDHPMVGGEYDWDEMKEEEREMFRKKEQKVEDVEFEMKGFEDRDPDDAWD